MPSPNEAIDTVKELIKKADRRRKLLEEQRDIEWRLAELLAQMKIDRMHRDPDVQDRFGPVLGRSLEFEAVAENLGIPGRSARRWALVIQDLERVDISIVWLKELGISVGEIASAVYRNGGRPTNNPAKLHIFIHQQIDRLVSDHRAVVGRPQALQTMAEDRHLRRTSRNPKRV